MMKKWIALILIFVPVLGLATCGAAPEAPAVPESSTVVPLPDAVDMNALDDCMVRVSFEQADLTEKGIHVMIYAYERFDMADISTLEPGSTIVLRGEPVTVETIERTDHGSVCINGDIGEGGYFLCTDDSGVFFERGFNDHRYYHELGNVVLPVAEDFVFTDASDLDIEPVTCSYKELRENNELYQTGFSALNTELRTESGRVVELSRHYIP